MKLATEILAMHSPLSFNETHIKYDDKKTIIEIEFSLFKYILSSRKLEKLSLEK